MYQPSAAYIFMLNTGLGAGEMLGILNKDVDLENRGYPHPSASKLAVRLMQYGRVVALHSL